MADRPRPSRVHGAEPIDSDRPFPGVRRETSQGQRSTITAYAFEPGAVFPLHAHAEEQVTVILEGEVEFSVAGEPLRLGPGETAVVGGGVEHGLVAGPAGARFLAVVVPRRERSDSYEIRSSR